MPNRGPDDELLAAALAGAHDCPPLEQLERLCNDEAPEPLKRHVEGCPHCQTELQMLRSFSSGEVADHEKTAVDSIVARLKAKSSAERRPAGVEHRSFWWNGILAVRWLTPAAAALAVVLVAAGVVIEMRQGRRPALETTVGGADVFRSSAIAILSPIGDVREKPAEIRWQAAQNAARYQVKIMEVDRAELWRAETATARIDLPPSVESLIVPAKTLLIQIGAFDATGRKIAESEIVRFRLLQNVYTQ